MDWGIVVDNLPNILSGTLLTIELVAQSVLYGLVLAGALAMMRVSRNPLLWLPAYAYIFFFRGTPLLVQIFLIYYGSGQFRSFFTDIGLWHVLREAYWCAIIALTLNTAGYTAEIFRGGILAVPHGEIEAARACGMSGWRLYRRIVLPKAFRIALPAYGNEIILLVKGSALVSTITLFELMGWSRKLVADTFAVWEIFLLAGAIYLLINYGIARGIRYLDRRLNRHLHATASENPA